MENCDRPCTMSKSTRGLSQDATEWVNTEWEMHRIICSLSKQFVLSVSVDDRFEYKCLTRFTNSTASLLWANPPTSALCWWKKRAEKMKVRAGALECLLLLCSLATRGRCCVAYESQIVVRAFKVPPSPEIKVRLTYDALNIKWETIMLILRLILLSLQDSFINSLTASPNR